MRTRGIHHLAVRTPELGAAERFYVDLLGLPVLERFSNPDGSPRSVWVALSEDAFLALERTPSGMARQDDEPGWHCIALRIERADRERWRERLAAAGHPIEHESDYTLYVRDPAGALVGLSHHPEPDLTSPK
jgi:catechol 2,3-dioxygenase-like lactoylglutathione lyase family enzyme